MDEGRRPIRPARVDLAQSAPLWEDEASEHGAQSGQPIAYDPSVAERRLASSLIDHYDDAIQSLQASDVKAGNYVQAGAVLKQARGLLAATSEARLDR